MRDTRTLPDRHGARYRADQDSAATPGLPAGTLVGRYVILHLVGSGGMGQVYSAYDPELDRRVAIKLLRRSVESPSARDRLRAEGRAMAKLAHPNVVAVYDVGSYGEQMFVAMEFVEGQTLSQWLQAERRGWRDVLEVFSQAGAGLAAAHAVGIVHQDFKPSNVMLAADGSVRVVDFGLAKPGGDGDADDDGAMTIDQESNLAGTPGYVAPERLRGRPPDPRGDQFSFCVTLERALGAQTAGDVEGPRQAARGRAPRWLYQAVRKGRALDPEDRFASMGELLVVISLDRRRRRLRRWLSLAALALAAVIGWGYLRTVAERRELCTGAPSKLADAWNPEISAEIRSAFVVTGAPFAEDAFDHVATAAERYSGAWQAAYTEACRATHVLGEQSERLLDLRMHCLSARLGELRSLGNLLISADRKLVSSAAEAMTSLTPLDACADLGELARRSPLPADPTARDQVDAARDTVAEHLSRYNLGQRVDVSALEAAAETGRTLDYPPLEAEALLVAARVLEDPKAGEDYLHRALRAAIAADSRLLEVRIYTQLIHQVGFLQSRHQDARRYGHLGEAALASLGEGRTDAEVHLFVNLGNNAYQEGRRDAARERYLHAETIVEGLGEPVNPGYANLYSNLAMLQGPEPEAEERARSYVERALRIQETAYGLHNPKLGPSLVNLAGFYALQGDYEEAVALVERCLAIQEDFFEREHRDMTFPLLLRGQLLIAADRAREAEPSLRRALPLARSGFGEDSFLATLVHLALSESLTLQGRFAEAEQQLGRAGTIYEARLAPGQQGLRLTLRLQAGELQLARRRYKAAIREMEPALQIEPADPSERRDAWRLHIALGEAHSGLGQRTLARSFLEWAAGEIRPGVDSHLAARARFALARELTDDEPERALELALAARRDIETGDGAQARKLRRELEDWLDRHRIEVGS